MLESSNIKLASVFTDVYGKTAWHIIEQLVDGEQNIKNLMLSIHGNVKASKKQIKKALKGTLQDHHRIVLRTIMKHIIEIENHIKDIEDQINEKLQCHADKVNLVKTIPGIGDTVAATVLAEIGTDMNQFPTEKHLSSWAGLSPGNHESAGKKKVLV